MASIASSPSRLIKLSEIIARNTKLLNSHLADKKLPQPSFAADAPPDGIVIGKNEPRRNDLEKARRELVSATKELHDLSVGARESVRSLAWDVSSLQHVICSCSSSSILLSHHKIIMEKMFDHGDVAATFSDPVHLDSYLIIPMLEQDMLLMGETVSMLYKQPTFISYKN